MSTTGKVLRRMTVDDVMIMRLQGTMRRLGLSDRHLAAYYADLIWD